MTPDEALLFIAQDRLVTAREAVEALRAKADAAGFSIDPAWFAAADVALREFADGVSALRAVVILIREARELWERIDAAAAATGAPHHDAPHAVN